MEKLYTLMLMGKFVIAARAEDEAITDHSVLFCLCSGHASFVLWKANNQTELFLKFRRLGSNYYSLREINKIEKNALKP